MDELVQQNLRRLGRGVAKNQWSFVVAVGSHHHQTGTRKGIGYHGDIYTVYPLVMTNIAMENCPFIDGLPIKNGDFPWLC